jgi:predicted dienelactone hydrolase
MGSTSAAASLRAAGFAAVVLLGLLGRTARAAGYQRLVVPAANGEPAIPIMVWSPCARAASASQLGPYVIEAVPDCPITGTSLPLVVISHGKGGSLLGHHDTAVALADAGFAVVSLNHPGDSFGDDSASEELRTFESRPRDVSRVLTFLLERWPQRRLLDAAAIGVFGFSRGGYTALALAGAAPSVSASAGRFCSAWWSLALALCRQLSGAAAQLKPRADSRVRAVVVVDPLNLFDAAALQQVHVPLQLWASELGGDGVALEHVEAIRAALPQAPEYQVARGAGHFAYLAPCPDEFKRSSPHICEDPKGFSREAWHRTLNASVVAFFTRQLRPGGPDAGSGVPGAAPSAPPARPGGG